MAQINTNLYSLNAQRSLAKNSLGLQSAIERLSSGLRVNSARDDATGLTDGLTLDASARVLAVEIRDQNEIISNNQIADAALAVVGDMQIRLTELQAMGQGTGDEASALITSATQIQSDANTAVAGTSATFTAVTISATASVLNTATTGISALRAKAGAAMNNAEFNIQAKMASYEGQVAKKSRIMDADFAQETSNLSRFQILQQAGTAMVSQANAIPQNVLALLR
jgi:flagellin